MRLTWAARSRVLAAAVLVASTLISGCSSSASESAGRARLDRGPAAAALLRAVISGKAFDLAIYRLRKPGSLNGKPRCGRMLGPQWYSLNWSAADGTARVPKTLLGVRSTDGTPMTVWLGSACRIADNVAFGAMASGSQLVVGGAMPSDHPAAKALRITIDGHSVTVHLRRTCTDRELAVDYADRQVPCSDNPVSFARVNGYSTVVRIS